MDKATMIIQRERVYEAFKGNPKTMLEVAVKTGILRANVCRYVSGFERIGKIAMVEKTNCSISKHPAGFYTTDPEKFPKSPQMKIFGDE